jgi:hypothetical protein
LRAPPRCWVEECCLAWVLVAVRSRVAVWGRVVVRYDGTGVILGIAMAGDVASATGSGEAMAAPAVCISPVGPGAYAEEDAIVEVAIAVVAVGGAGVWSVVIVAPLADRRGTTEIDAYADLGVGLWHECHCHADCSSTQ